jgi:hypothetical protein
LKHGRKETIYERWFGVDDPDMLSWTRGLLVSKMEEALAFLVDMNYVRYTVHPGRDKNADTFAASGGITIHPD